MVEEDKSFDSLHEQVASSGRHASSRQEPPTDSFAKVSEIPPIPQQPIKARKHSGKAKKASELTEVSAPGLFTPMALRGAQMRNRIWLPPMCLYSVYQHDGVPTAFHYQHYVSRALGGFGMVIFESTAVSPEGRISPCDLGLWDERQTQALKRIVVDVKAAGAVPVVQLNHAGRKASSGCSSTGYVNRTVPEDEGGWQPVGPSPIAFGKMSLPQELSFDEIQEVIADFRSAAERAVHAGFAGIEIHAAHGYLLSQFLDPLCNTRSDDYGGTLENRMRLTREVTQAVRSVIPATMPLLVRVSATDWAEGGWDLPSTIELARALKRDGADLIDVSTGGIVPGVHIPAKANYQVPFAKQVRAKALIPTTAVGLITKPKQAERIVRKEEADAVEIGRAALRDPYWPLRAAYKLGLSTNEAPYPEPYERAAFGTSR